MTVTEAVQLIGTVSTPPSGWRVTMNASGRRMVERARRLLGPADEADDWTKRLDVTVYDEIGGDPIFAITDGSRTVFINELDLEQQAIDHFVWSNGLNA